MRWRANGSHLLHWTLGGMDVNGSIGGTLIVSKRKTNNLVTYLSDIHGHVLGASLSASNALSLFHGNIALNGGRRHRIGTSASREQHRMAAGHLDTHGMAHMYIRHPGMAWHTSSLSQ